MRRAFGYEGCPVVLVPKARPKTIEPLRKFGSKQPDKNSGRTRGKYSRGKESGRAKSKAFASSRPGKAGFARKNGPD